VNPAPRRFRSRVFRTVPILAVLSAIALGAAPAASAHACGRKDGTKIQAYNLSCRKARSVYGGQPPKGWFAGNLDIAGGLLIYCHAADQETVVNAIDVNSGRVHPRELHGAPLVIARVAYGE
jgi:hypothetical protein